MKKLIVKTKDDESIGVDKNYIFEEVHAASTGIDAFNSDNSTLKKLVIQALVAREHITHDNNSGKIKIMSIGKKIRNIPTYNYLHIQGFPFGFSRRHQYVFFS
jgi:hypothetical protein